MAINVNNLLLALLGIVLVLCFVLMLMDNGFNPFLKLNSNGGNGYGNNNIEGFDPVIDAIQSQLETQNPEQLKSTIQALQQRLIDYGYSPDMQNYVRKTELGPNAGKCIVATAEDRDKYVSKSDVPPPGPRIDLSQYVKKSSIPPEKVCPPAPTVDLSAYVKKSTLPPNEKCPPCIAPKVKVSAGLCRECPPPPPCPAPEPCPSCNCPAPAPCPPQKECKKCDEIRYIKVPAVITKTITLDANGNVVSQQIDSGSTNPTAATTTTQPQATPAAIPTTTQSLFNLKSLWGSGSEIPNTTFPTMTTSANTNLAQTLATTQNGSLASPYCPSADLNSEFKKHSSQISGRDVSNYIY